MNKEEVIRKTLPLFQKSGFVLSASLFGSFARGEETPESDVDFLVELAAGTSLLDLSGLILDLRQILHKKVDVVSKGGIHPHLATRILNDTIPFYEKR